WHTAMANAASVPVDVMVFGDSIVEGLNPSGDGGDKITDRWLNRWAALTRTRYGLSAGGVGYVSLLNNISNGASQTAGYFTGYSSGTLNFPDTRAFAHQSYFSGTDITLH